MDENHAPPFRILSSLRRLADTGLASLKNRIELVAVELQEEKCWLIATLLWAAVAVFFCGLAILFVVATIVYLSPEPARGWVLGAFALTFITIAAMAIIGLRRSIHDKPPPLAATLDELKKDLEWIESQD